MTTFHQQVLKDGVVTEAGMRAMELVYEALTGECWHRDVKRHELEKRAFGGYPIYEIGIQCACGDAVYSEKAFNIHLGMNPTLLTSLDAWRPLWERMDVEQKITHQKNLTLIWCDNPVEVFYWETTPHHHLEAALRTLEVECPECEGTGNSYSKTRDVTKRHIPCTCTNGKITLMDKWEKEDTQ